MTNIYVLKDPTTNEIRYVGKTKQKLKNRLRSHLTDHKRYKSHKINWIKSLSIQNLEPTIELVVAVEDYEWEKWEIYYIKYYRDLGYDLTNMTDGGTAYEELNKLMIKSSSIKVNQFTLEGILIKSWNSAKEAARTLNILNSHICENARGSIKSYKNFIWSYNDSIDVDKYKWRSRKEIVELDNNNNIIKEWKSIVDAARYYNVSEHSIKRVLYNERKHFRGHKWLYKN